MNFHEFNGAGSIEFELNNETVYLDIFEPTYFEMNKSLYSDWIIIARGG